MTMQTVKRKRVRTYGAGQGCIATDRGNVKLRRWWKRLGTAAVRTICQEAAVDWEYFRHCAAGRRRLSIDAARRIIEVAGSTAPDLAVLVPPKPVAKRQGATA